ncbi:MspA family porin [Mycolicibacterium litorale]|uniref:MspA family porin n=1 Tax=Mycolicibacterium litorale TaxID=758802 RepID=UPI003CF372A1
MRVLRYRLIGALCLMLGMGIGVNPSVAHAGLDDENTLIDGGGRTLTIQQWDTFLNGVAPLDRNRLTREWFHTGRAKYAVSGPGADSFKGTLSLGYQIQFPWVMGVGLNFTYTTPNFQEWGSGIVANEGLLAGAVTPPLLPGVSLNVQLGNGPGIQDITTIRTEIGGASGAVAVSNGHGTVTGAAGGVTLRPFARLEAESGDVVTTYGEIWNMG